MTYFYDPTQHPDHIFLVGAGGTGAHIARHLARICYDKRERGQKIPTVTIIDPDIIELGNCGRQIYGPSETGSVKSQTVAKRLNSALGLEIRAIAEPFDARKHIANQRYEPVLLIGAVDNAAARRELASVERAIYLDAGNHYDSGNVILGTNTTRKPSAYDHRYTDLPTAAVVHPELLIDELDTPAVNLSCAELTERGDQHLFINDLIATVAANYLYKLLYRLPISTWITYVSSDPMALNSIEITPENIDYYWQKAR